MGLETRCEAVVDGVTHHGRALLETTEVLFRSDLARCVVPLETIRSTATVEGGWLHLGALSLKLGPTLARTWLSKIQNPKSVLTKLGITAGQVAVLRGDVPDELEPMLLAHGVTVQTKASPDCWFFFGVTSSSQLSKLPVIGPKNVLWVLRPKGPTSPVPEAATRSAARGAGLVDVKVVGFSATHSAEKYVRRRSPK